MNEILKEILQTIITALAVGVTGIIARYLPKFFTLIGKKLNEKIHELPASARVSAYWIVGMLENKFPDLPGQVQKEKGLTKLKEMYPGIPTDLLDSALEDSWDALRANLNPTVTVAGSDDGK